MTFSRFFLISSLALVSGCGSTAYGGDYDEAMEDAEAAEDVQVQVQVQQAIIEDQDVKVDDINEDLAAIIAKLRAEKGLPPKAPYVSPQQKQEPVDQLVVEDQLVIEDFLPGRTEHEEAAAPKDKPAPDDDE